MISQWSGLSIGAVLLCVSVDLFVCFFFGSVCLFLFCYFVILHYLFICSVLLCLFVDFQFVLIACYFVLRSPGRVREGDRSREVSIFLICERLAQSV